MSKAASQAAKRVPATTSTALPIFDGPTVEFPTRFSWAAAELAPVPVLDLPDKPRILIVKLSAIGDCLIASPVARALRERYPKAHIAWAVQAKSKAVVEGNPFLDEVIVWQSSVSGARQARGMLSAMRAVRRGRFDAVLDLQGAFKSAPIVAASGARWRVASSRAETPARHASNVQVLVPDPPPHAAEQYLRVAQALGADPRADRRLIMPVSDDDRAWAEAFLQENGVAPGPLIGLNPGAARAIKQWPVEHFAALCDALEERGLRTILFGGPGDMEAVARLLETAQSQPVVAAGKTSLRRLAALLERCTLLVTGDTGPMHIAAGVGTPIVALFGPTDPIRTGPVGDQHLIVRRDLPCVPCLQRPICDRFQCLSDLPPSDVLASVLRALKTD